MVLDSNFFIQAHRVTYPLDVATSFWDKVKELSHAGRLISVDKVRAELYQNNDPLSEWCKQHLPANFFCDTASCLGSYARVSQWAIVNEGNYTSGAVSEFLDADEADAWLISYSLEHSFPLVTHEVSKPNSRAKIKIPDVCKPFNVRTLDTIQMFRSLGERF